ncbi:MAG: metallophosphoesterase [Desulfurococcaceae archaeon]
MFKKISLGKLRENVVAIPGYPVVYLPHEDLIVLSDLHLGFEEAVARGLYYDSKSTSSTVGMFIPKIQFRNVISMLDKLLNIVKTKRILINGDVKHAFDRLLRQERLEVSRLIEFLFSRGVEDIVLVRGNHDNFLIPVLKNYGLKLTREYVIESGGSKILFTHGHLDTVIEDYDLIIMGHEHPRLRCFGIYKLPSILIIPSEFGNDILVLPASGAYHPGTAVTLSRETYLSPIIKKHGIIEEARVVSWITIGGSGGLDKEVLMDKKNDFGEGFEISFFEVCGDTVAVLEFGNIDLAINACGL